MSFETVLGSAEPMSGELLVGGSVFVLELTDVLTLVYKTPDGTEKQKVLTIANASTGAWLAEWVAGDLPLAGGYQGKIKVERSSDDTFPRYFPDDGNRIIWWVYPTI